MFRIMILKELDPNCDFFDLLLPSRLFPDGDDRGALLNFFYEPDFTERVKNSIINLCLECSVGFKHLS